MKTRIIVLLLLIACSYALSAQQLYLEGFTGRNSSSFDLSPYDSPQWSTPAGGRLAFGADHLQFGGEYLHFITNPKWNEVDVLNNKIGETEFQTTYYGAFIRGKICRYPAMRFGLVLRAGAGLFNTDRLSSAPLLPKKVSYDQKLGVIAGAGVSIPITRPIMLELSYDYYYVDYDEVTGQLPPMEGSFHSIQAGLSFNFVFGKRANDYRHLRENWKWREGWRG